MDCTEAYREHIMYSFNGFCKVVIRYAAINAWRDRNRRRQKEISFEYLTEEKFYPLSTSDEFLKSPYEQYPVTICGQTIILTNGELAAALLSLPEKKREIIYLYFFGNYTQQEIADLYGHCKSTAWHYIHSALQMLQRNGGIFTWGILTLCHMKPLSGRQTASRKPWTRFYGITANESALPPLKTGTSTQTPRTA